MGSTVVSADENLMVCSGRRTYSYPQFDDFRALDLLLAWVRACETLERH